VNVSRMSVNTNSSNIFKVSLFLRIGLGNSLF
jgi:hypothetical protein